MAKPLNSRNTGGFAGRKNSKIGGHAGNKEYLEEPDVKSESPSDKVQSHGLVEPDEDGHHETKHGHLSVLFHLFQSKEEPFDYCLQFFRQALLLNYNADSLVFLQPKTPGFKLENFAPFVHSNNILEINKELNDAIYHIERNGNAKIILLDLSIKLTRLLHAKE